MKKHLKRTSLSMDHGDDTAELIEPITSPRKRKKALKTTTATALTENNNSCEVIPTKLMKLNTVAEDDNEAQQHKIKKTGLTPNIDKIHKRHQSEGGGKKKKTVRPVSDAGSNIVPADNVKEPGADKETDDNTLVISEKKARKHNKRKREDKLLDVQVCEVESQTESKDIFQQYPLLRDNDLVDKFRNVTLTNNQKGRIRQTLKEITKGASDAMLPDVLHSKIMNILQSTTNITDSDLRKIRVLHNMLKVAVDKKILMKTSVAEPVNDSGDKAVEIKVDAKVNKTKEKIQRYVVFIGNLPIDVNKDQLLEHFCDVKSYAKDVRIPERGEGKKSAIAYLELANSTAYQIALSKHHSMFRNKRINVLYTAHKNSKLSKSEIKSKAAKMSALIKTGQLVGSMGAHRKRGQRRAKMKKALKDSNT